jgi:kynurenine formamidase
MTADMIPVDKLVVPLAVIDVSAKAAANTDYELSRDDLVAWEHRYGRLPDNCCVAMNSGWAKHVTDGAKFTGRDANGVLHFPGFGPKAVDWLLKQRKVVGLAVDTLSLDPGPSKDFKVHVAWLPTNRWGLENVANLDKVPPVGATLVVGVIKVKDATGGPARLLALM